MIIEHPIKFGTAKVELNSCPINAAWIIAGRPIARNRVLSGSADGTASTLIWDCTAGKFNWFYSIDETVCLLEGSVTVKDQAGVSRRLEAGDTAFFPAGSHAEWTVDRYVRKIAFCRNPLPRSVVLAKQIYRSLKRLLGNRVSGAPSPAMFGGA